MPWHRAPLAALALAVCCTFSTQAAGAENTPAYHPLGSTKKPSADAQSQQPDAQLPKIAFEMKVHYHSDGRVEMRCEQMHQPARSADDNRQEKEK